MKTQLLNGSFVWKLFKDSAIEWNKDNAMRLGAALSYYSIFSIAPLLMIAVGIIGWVYGKDAQSHALEMQLSSMLGPKAAEAVNELVKNASESSGGATFVGFITLFVGASGVFAQLKDSLDTMWEVRTKSGLGIWVILRERLLSFSMVLVIGFLLLVSLTVTTVVTAMGTWMQHRLGIPTVLSGLLGYVVPLLIETVLFAFMYKMLPSARIRWECVLVGAVFTSVLFELGKQALSWYLAKGSATSSVGATGAIVVVIVWVYYASLIMFFGASVTEVYARMIGHPIQPSLNAESTDIVCPKVAGAGGISLSMEPGSALTRGPQRESLLPMLREANVESQRVLGPRIPPATMPEQTRAWVREIHANPMAEVGAALGVGLLLGLISRLLDRSGVKSVSAREHFRLGAESAADQGLTAAGHAWELGKKLWARTR